MMQGRYVHARQMKRVAKQTRKLKTYLVVPEESSSGVICKIVFWFMI